MKRDIPKKFQALYRKALTGKSRRAAIRSFCLECVGYQQAEVDRCPAIACPLHPFRLPSGVDKGGLADETAEKVTELQPKANATPQSSNCRSKLAQVQGGAT